MEISRHLSLFKKCSLAWLGFTLVGGSSYYRTWSQQTLWYYCVIIYLGLGLLIYRMITHYQGNKLVRAFWIAFYISAPLFIYDYIYITYWLREPFDLANRFWFLAVFYIIPWMQGLMVYLYIEAQGKPPFAWALTGGILLALAVICRVWWPGAERMTMFGFALHYAIYGTVLAAGILAVGRFIRGYFCHQ